MQDLITSTQFATQCHVSMHGNLQLVPQTAYWDSDISVTSSRLLRLLFITFSSSVSGMSVLRELPLLMGRDLAEARCDLEARLTAECCRDAFGEVVPASSPSSSTSRIGSKQQKTKIFDKTKVKMFRCIKLAGD